MITEKVKGSGCLKETSNSVSNALPPHHLTILFLFFKKQQSDNHFHFTQQLTRCEAAIKCAAQRQRDAGLEPTTAHGQQLTPQRRPSVRDFFLQLSFRSSNNHFRQFSCVQTRPLRKSMRHYPHYPSL